MGSNDLWMGLFLFQCAGPSFAFQNPTPSHNLCTKISLRKKSYISVSSPLINGERLQESSEFFSRGQGRRRYDWSRLSASTEETSTTLPEPIAKELIERKNVDPSAGILFAAVIITALGLSSTDPEEFNALVSEEGLVFGFARQTLENVVDATVPTTTTDLVSVALGESIGGIIGAAATYLVGILLKQRLPTVEERVATSPVTNALADTDFFITNSASLPLLLTAGVPLVPATIASAVFASVPSQLVKIGAKQKEQLLEEERLMDELLAEEKERNKRKPQDGIFMPFQSKPIGLAEGSSTVDPGALKPVQKAEVDFVDVFSDVTRWLEYGVLKADFGTMLEWNGHLLDPAMSGALFGAFAATSSKFYADILYGYYNYGPSNRQDEVRSRSVSDWISIYLATGIGSASLFGIYEFSQRPVSRYLQGMLAGGVEGCVGSEDFDLCMQTFIDVNAPGPSTEAQLRALATNLYMVYERIQYIAVDTSPDDIRALVGAWAVTAYSYLQRLPF